MEKTKIILISQRCCTQPFVVVGSIIERNKKFLLVQEGGKWNQPMGWLELREDIIDGAKRETEEETGYHNFEVVKEEPIYIHHFSFVHPNTGEEIEKTVTFYLFKLLDYKLVPTKEMDDEHLEGRWFSLEEAIQKITFDDLRIILEKTKENLYTN